MSDSALDAIRELLGQCTPDEQGARHGEALAAYDETAKVQVSGSTEARLVYVPRLTAATLKEVERVAALGGSLTVYSWQPGQLRQRIEAGNVSFEKIPEFLVKRFGGGK